MRALGNREVNLGRDLVTEIPVCEAPSSSTPSRAAVDHAGAASALRPHRQLVNRRAWAPCLKAANDSRWLGLEPEPTPLHLNDAPLRLRLRGNIIRRYEVRNVHGFEA